MEHNRNIVTIGGPGIVVEIDESKFGKVKYNRGHRVEGVWVFGIVERTPERKIVFVPLENRKSSTLEEILKKFVHPGSIIHSDSFKAYNNLKDIFKEHKKVNHSLNFVDPVTGTHTNTIEGNRFGVKDQITVRHRTKKYIELYLIRYTLRRNSKNIFEMVLSYLLK